MKQKLTTLILALMVGLSAWAYDFEVDGICYKITSSDDLTVEVTYNGYYNGKYNYYGKYTGTVEIPSTVSYSSKTYSVTSIGQYAFSGCIGLTSVTIPNSMTSIGDWAFYDCSVLTSVTIPNSVTSIGNSAFNNCISLKTVNFNAEKCTYMGSSGNFVFGYCTSLTELNIGDKVQIIPSYAFYGRSGLTSVTIPSGVSSIGDYAFHNCSNLISVTIPSTVTSIGGNSFDTFPNSSSYYPISNINFIGTIEDWCSKEWSPYSVSHSYDLYLNGEKISSVILPDGMTKICPKAFENCTSLTSVTIPSSVTEIGGSAFSGCSGLTSVTIPSGVTEIAYSTFTRCSSLTSISIPESVTSIGVYAFSGCENLTSVTIPGGLTSIGDYAFYECSGLTVTISSGMASIGDDKFKGASIKNLTIEDSDESIEFKAYSFPVESMEKMYMGRDLNSDCLFFVDMKKLTDLEIGSQVTQLPKNMFSGCTALYSVKVNATTPPALSDGCFLNVAEQADLYVPKGSKSKYERSYIWRDFYSIIEFDDSTTEIEDITTIIPDASVREGIYNLQGQKLSAPQRGLNIINGKKVIIK